MEARGSDRARRRVRAYVSGAVQEIRKTALYAAEVDWDAVEREARSVLDGAVRYADTHAFLAAVLQQAGGRHSQLSAPDGAGRARLSLVGGTEGGIRASTAMAAPPRMAQALGVGAGASGHRQIPAAPIPTGHLVGSGAAAVGYLRLPRLPGGRGLTRGYLADGTAVMRGLTGARPAGWIVDLRANGGGRAWPMLAVAAPLLPEGVLGHFLLAGGRVQAWSARGGRIKLDRRTVARGRVPRPGGEPTPIAVLTSGRTASAGEVVALAFRAQPRARLIGTPTAGLTTGNRTVVLRDGTKLRISGAVYADRHRNPVEGPVPVDERVEEDGPDGAMRAALAWIRGVD